MITLRFWIIDEEGTYDSLLLRTDAHSIRDGDDVVFAYVEGFVNAIGGITLSPVAYVDVSEEVSLPRIEGLAAGTMNKLIFRCTGGDYTSVMIPCPKVPYPTADHDALVTALLTGPLTLAGETEADELVNTLPSAYYEILSLPRG